MKVDQLNLESKNQAKNISVVFFSRDSWVMIGHTNKQTNKQTQRDYNLYSYRTMYIWYNRGKNCEVDINECEDRPCLNNGTCHDLVNHFECVCQGI